MQALADYADDSDTSPPPAGPSRLGGESEVRPKKRWRLPRRTPTPSPPRSHPPSRQSPGENGSHAAAKRRRSVSPTASGGQQSTRGTSRAVSLSEGDFDRLAGMSDNEIFRQATLPSGPEESWMPPEPDPATCDPRLQAKVAQFLRLKREGQHINTSLMQSSSFANPHIYAKLVEFVDLDERATAFPGGGWLTRRKLEDEVPKYGPKALLAQQNAMAEAVKRAQEGKRREIAFTSSSRRGGDRDRERDRDERRREDRDRDRRREEKGGLRRPRQSWEGAGRRERDRR